MKIKILLFLSSLVLLFSTGSFAMPSFNGNGPGCTGSGCHNFSNGIVTVTVLSNNQVQISLSGTTSKVAGELVDGNGNVVAVNNSTSNNPFILTAPSNGTYLVNAGYKNPTRLWDSATVVINAGVAPNAPGNLSTEIIPSPLSVQLNWTDNSDNEDGFIIEREDVFTNAFNIIDSVSANTTSFIDTTNISINTFVYRLKAYNAFGESPYSDTSQVILPVEISAFSAAANEKIINLGWTTVTETNNKGFEIQRKLENGNWTFVKFIQGKGNSTEKNNYQASDNLEELIYNGIIEYRLKQIDFDGSYTYSNTQSVEVDLVPVKYSLSQNFPNPFNPSTKIKYTLPEKTMVVIKVYDVLGKEVAELIKGVKEAGDYEIEFKANNLQSGIYFYRVEAGNFVQTKKMILLK